MKVDVFIPSYMDQFYPEQAENVFHVLKHLGVKAKYNTEQTSCGETVFNMGDRANAETLAAKFLKDFSEKNTIVVPSSSCVDMVKNHYTKFFFNTSLHLDLKDVQARIIEFSDFLVEVLKISKWEGRLDTKICFNEGCFSSTHSNTITNTKTLLSMIEGVELIKMDYEDEYCGHENSFSHILSELSVEMGLRKLKSAIKTGAEYLICTEASCLFHLDSIIKKENMKIKTATLADLLVWAIQA